MSTADSRRPGLSRYRQGSIEYRSKDVPLRVDISATRDAGAIGSFGRATTALESQEGEGATFLFTLRPAAGGTYCTVTVFPMAAATQPPPVSK
jgi:hypothetical protein